MIPPILLLDTHTLPWFLRDDPRLGARARVLIADPSNRVLVSVVSCWEIAIKAGRGKMNPSEPSRTLLERELPANGMELLQISLGHATAVEGLPHHHRDPFDRLLIAQAIVAALDAYPVRRVW